MMQRFCCSRHMSCKGPLKKASLVQGLGAGTYRDGQPLWEKLAQEYAEGGGGPDMMASEVELHRANGMEIVLLFFEHLADTSAEHLKSAGGAMVRLFYV